MRIYNELAINTAQWFLRGYNSHNSCFFFIVVDNRGVSRRVSL